MDKYLPLIKFETKRRQKKPQNVQKKFLKIALHSVHSNSFFTQKKLDVYKLDHRWRTSLIQ